uniref:Uncharacterized protein n=1 Tax=Megaselia scalaris TaxID=36166 RepID=T1GFD0_MEGSC
MKAKNYEKYCIDGAVKAIKQPEICYWEHKRAKNPGKHSCPGAKPKCEFSSFFFNYRQTFK